MPALQRASRAWSDWRDPERLQVSVAESNRCVAGSSYRQLLLVFGIPRALPVPCLRALPFSCRCAEVIYCLRVCTPGSAHGGVAVRTAEPRTTVGEPWPFLPCSEVARAKPPNASSRVKPVAKSSRIWGCARVQLARAVPSAGLLPELQLTATGARCVS